MLFFIEKFLLTPPDEGPRVKGQRIKLQDIIDGYYNPSNGNNNGCWISCKYYTYNINNLLDFYQDFNTFYCCVDFGVYLSIVFILTFHFS